MKQNKLFLYPYLFWLLLFILAPMLLIVFYAFTGTDANGFYITFESFTKSFDMAYITVLIRSIWMSGVATLVCLVLGYPLAYGLAKKVKNSNIAMLLIMIPMWMNFLLRTYAWLAILDTNGVVNTILNAFGLPSQKLLYTSSAIILGMVYNYLPFMVLPIYNQLLKIPNDLYEASLDLGADSKTTFLKITLPLSKPGIISGITMVFLPGVTTFAISRLLGGSKFMLMGDLIENQFMLVRDWHFGSTLSFIMLVVMLVVMKFVNNDVEDGGLM